MDAGRHWETEREAFLLLISKVLNVAPSGKSFMSESLLIGLKRWQIGVVMKAGTESSEVGGKTSDVKSR
ncbi:hypothetical protein TNCV_2087311 [Trichonephila clavipes]|nr:hypothetical protein TNCV_2087311 [Trichonephila clavipes]